MLEPAFGKIIDPRGADRVSQFTPTSVGTAPLPRAAFHLQTVHPHKRGDSHARQRGAPRVYGSPPQAWGQRVAAGSSTTSPAVHPHKRGDSHALNGDAGLHGGSPPQAWGQRQPTPAESVVSRFTPTSVGTAAARASGWPHSPVHPHKRGDSCQHRSHRARDRGSPPQAWGQPLARVTVFSSSPGSPPQAWGQRPNQHNSGR